MYDRKFITELFRPQPAYTLKDARAVFDKLAHSSIMRLNKTSMDKLFDLMAMGVKQQVLATSHPGQLLEVTLNHLDALQDMVSNPAVAQLLSDCTAQVLATYRPLNTPELFRLKHALMAFFQDKRVKVSLFLQGGLQHLDGTLVLHRDGPVPPGGSPPGPITYFNIASVPCGHDHVPSLSVPAAVHFIKSPVLDRHGRSCALGYNMYSTDRSKLKGGPPLPGPNAAVARGSDFLGAGAGAVGSATAASSLAVLTGQDGAMAGGFAGSSEGKGKSAGESSGAMGLNLLASMLGGASAEAPSGGGAVSMGGDSFQLNLFGDTAGDALPAGAAHWGSDVIVFDARDAGGLARMMGQLEAEWGEGGEGKAPEEQKDAGDDLLDLMDG